MSHSPHKLREILLQLLYSSDMGQPLEEDMLLLLSEELKIPKTVIGSVQKQLRDIQEHKEELDRIIQETSVKHAFERIPCVECNILRLAVYELTYVPSIPPKVVIAEAIRLCRKFSTAESASYINAILDTLYQKRNLTEGS